MTLMLETDAVSVSVDGLGILEPTTLALPAGESLAIRGRNGSGKTTLLRVIAARQRPSSGEVRVAGDPVSDRDPRFRARVSALLGLPAFAPDLTIRELLRVIAASWGVEAPHARADALLEELEIGALGERFATELSSGQTQLCAIATTLIRPCDLLLLDEPEQRLDADRRGLVAAAVNRRRAAGLTVVFASHNSAFIEAVADREHTIYDA